MTPRQRRPADPSTVDWSVVEAGGIAPAVDGAVRSGVDVVTARTYGHPALGDRTVVRLVPAALGEAEDLALEFLGYEPAGAPRSVGTGARRSIGFPEWALVHDPANGRHALAMVKELARLARLAATKPGAAKDGYDALADRLGRAVPHFLPTFWEQAARSYVEAENPKLAATCFALAREAERVHALAVDEDRIADVHSEFALAGALPVKALTQYAEDLRARLGPVEAYRRYREVAVQRVAGGLPPPAGLLIELGRLGKAARLSATEEARSVLAELLDVAAVARSAPGFWQSARPHLVAMCRRDPALRLRLLAIRPKPPGWRTDLTEEWVGLLDATGASDLLTAAPSTTDAVDAAAWLQEFLADRQRRWASNRRPALLGLVERMVPRLLAQGRNLDPFGAWPASADLDIVDCLTAGGVPVAGTDQSLNVIVWARDTNPGARSMVALATAPHLRAAWRAGAVQAAQHLGEQWGTGPSGEAGLNIAVREWLDEQLPVLAEQPLLSLSTMVDTIFRMRWATATVSPDAVRAAAAVQVGPALARTLRTGLSAELGWPAYDEAVGRLNGRAKFQHNATWPQLAVHDFSRAVVVDRDRVVLDHALRIPPDIAKAPYGRIHLHYVDGRLVVFWYGRGYWSDRPDDVFEVREAWTDSVEEIRALPLPDGGLTTGHVPLRSGDRVLPSGDPVASDGRSFWRLETVEGRWPRVRRWREYDPATGVAGRISVPAFFEAGLSTPEDGFLLPLDGSLVGIRSWLGSGGELWASDVDGRRAVVSDPDRHARHLLLLPGSDEPRAVTAQRDSLHGHGHYTIHEPVTGWPASQVESGRGTPPVLWWRFMTPRDEAGSRALRSLRDEQAGELVAAVTAEGADERLEQAKAVVVAVLGSLTDERLIGAVAAQVVQAREIADRLADLGASAGHVQKGTVVSEQLLRQSLGGLGLGDLAGQFHSVDNLEHELWAFSEALTAGGPGVAPAAHGIVQYGMDWSELLGAEAAVALRLLGPGLPAEERHALRALLGALAGCPFVGTGGRVRVVILEAPEHYPMRGAVLRRGSHAAVVAGLQRGWSGRPRHDVSMLELDPTSGFGALPYTTLPRALDYRGPQPKSLGPATGMVVHSERRPVGWADGGRLGDLLARLDRDGLPPWRPEAVARLAELTGVNRGEAALLLAGMPGLAAYEANYLPKATRETLGLSVVEARTARDALAALPRPALVAVLDAALPADPAELWRVGPDVERLAAAWSLHFGQKVSLDPEVSAEAAGLVAARQGRWGVKAAAQVVEYVVGGPARDTLDGEDFPGNQLVGYAVALAWLAYRLSADDPVRPRLPVALQRVRTWLAAPARTISVGYHPPELGPYPALVGTPLANIVDSWQYELVPSRLSGPDDPALGLFPGSDEVRAIGWLLSDRCADAVGWTPASAGVGSFGQDPRVSAPSTVESVVAASGLSSDAAVYYLQLLALPDPTDKNVARWMGWSAKRLKELGATLVEAGLVVAAKRERSGRSVFLPGGWLSLKSPSLPIEAWKAPLYGLAPDGTAPLSVLVPLRPVAELFLEAWRRVHAGDPPAFESLASTPPR